MSNKYAAYCADCGRDCGPNHGELKKENGKWVVRCGGRATTSAKTSTPAPRREPREPGKPARKLTDEQATEILTREQCEWATKQDGSGLCEAGGYEREGKDDVEPGDIVGVTLRDKSRHSAIVLSVEPSYYMSRRDCEDAEDMDDFDRQPGWHTPYAARRVTEPVSVRERRVKRETEEAVKAAAAQAIVDAYEQAKAAVPADYGRRHGAAFDFTVTIASQDGTSESFPTAASVAPTALAWTLIAEMEKHTLYSAPLPDDGRLIYREEFRGYDDYRTTLWMPQDVYTAQLAADIRRLGITREKAEEWLAQYKGCVGTELYEFAAKV